MSKFCLIVTLALAIGSFQTVHGLPSTYIGTPCQSTCTFAFFCSPFFKQPVYSVVNGQCRVWFNSCFFNTENCSRRNQCQKELIETTKEVCIKYCPQFCTRIYKPVCATFVTNKEGGENIFRKVTFGNICELNSHVCQNGEPYVSQPTEGECEKIGEIE